MLVALKKNLAETEKQDVIAKIENMGFLVHLIEGTNKLVLGGNKNTGSFDPRKIKVIDGVLDVHKITTPYTLAGKEYREDNTVIKIDDVTIGGKQLSIMAGPCSVESEEQIFRIAKIVAENGVKILRGGAFKPRSSPYSFQGLGEQGLKYLRAAADEYGLKVITEILQNQHIEMVYKYTDIFQVGARNMQNFALLKDLSTTNKPVMIKRGISATVEELLMSAEYILAGGNPNVILCERGIRTFEKYTKHTFDLSSIPVIKDKTHLPVIADPSHAAAIRRYVPPMALAAVASGSDGLMLEIHDEPEKALSDGPQALLPNQFGELLNSAKEIAMVVGRSL